MSVATVIESGPDRHALLAPECDCGVCAPTWARRRGKSRRYVEPVTLVEALHGEAAEVRAGMLEEHRECLSAMVFEVDQLVAQSAVDDLGHPGVGLALVMFAGELASALRPTEFGAELPEGLRAVCAQTVTAAMLTAAGCLAGVAAMMGALAELAGY
jgi:hypothetical protein